ncbi:MAG: serine/threonine-protein kinase, partial [Planctomycetota bacterium]
EARCVDAVSKTLEIPASEVSAMVSEAQGRWRFFAARSVQPEADAELVQGSLVGDHFRIVDCLGAGGFAAVYRAHHDVLGVDVALKVLLPATRRGDPMADRRFVQEGRLCRTLAHRYITAVREVGRDPRAGPYIAMDLVSGKTLGEAVAFDAPRPREAIVGLALQVLEGLEEAHRAGIVHRDVKPDNILITQGPTCDEEVRLIDFGISKSSLTHPDDADATAAGTVMGSLSYMSPEQALGNKLDGRSDLYSLAVVLYEALCGCLPYEIAPDAEDLCRAMVVKIVVEAPRDPRVVDPSMPTALAETILRCLEKDPSARYETARELREALAASLI